MDSHPRPGVSQIHPTPQGLESPPLADQPCRYAPRASTVPQKRPLWPRAGRRQIRARQPRDPRDTPSPPRRPLPATGAKPGSAGQAAPSVWKQTSPIPGARPFPPHNQQPRLPPEQPTVCWIIVLHDCTCSTVSSSATCGIY